MLVGLASVGGIAILLMSFFAFSMLTNDDPPAVAGGDASPTPAASPSAEPTIAATPEATPDASPEPTPTGPPIELAVGDWATVTVDELDVRAGAGEDQESRSSLIRGAVLIVAEGPQVADGLNWYRVTSLGGAAGWAASGWEEEPYLETIASDPTLAECGQVRRPVFDTTTGAALANDVLRIGAFAVPTSAFSDPSLAAIELYRGMGQEVCFTARSGPDGQPDLSADLGVQACGHAAADGSILRLEPTDDDSVPLSSQVIDPTIVHPAVFTGLPADQRMSSNLSTIMAMMTNDGTSGCLNLNVTQRADSTEWYRAAQATQCSRVQVYNEDSIKFSPASGGPEAWIKLAAANFQPGLFRLERKLTVSVDASVDNNDNQSAYAHPYGEDACD
jgi:hypothetical protein